MGNAFLLIIVGLLLFYIMISDKFYCVEGFMACLGGTFQPGGVSGVGSGAAGVGVPTTVRGVGSILGTGAEPNRTPGWGAR